MKLNMERKKIFTIGLSLALIIFLTISSVSYWNTKRHIESMENAEKMFRFLYELGNLMSLLKDAETGERGFVITGNWTFLEPYYDGITAVHQSMKALKELTPVDAQAYQKLDAIQGMIDKRFAQFHETINLRKKKGIAAAIKLIMTGQGKKIMGDIRNFVEELKHEKTDLLQSLNRISQERSHRTFLTIVIGNLIAFLFVFFSFFQLYREIAERNRAEETLRKSEERYRTLVDNLPVGVYRNTPDPEGQFLMANPAFCKMFGFKNEEEVKDISPASIYQKPEERKQYSDNLIQKGLIKNDERTLLKRDGTPVYTSITSSVVYGKDGEISHFDSVMLDITGQKLSEEALKKSEEKYRNIFNNAQVGIFRTRISDGKVIECNDRFARTYGYKTPEECIDDFVVSERYTDPDVREKMVASLMEKGEVNDSEACFSRKDGDDVWIRFSARAYPEEGYLEGVGYDITEEKQALEDLRKSEQRFKEMADLLPTIICEIGMDLRVTYANSLAFEKTGFTPSDFDAGISAMDLLNPGDRNKAVKRVEQTLKGEKLESVEYRIYKKDGSQFPVLLNSAPIYKDGQITGIRFSMSDMAEQKKLERQLLQAQKMEAIGTLAGGVAHDLNNILGGLVGYPELLLMDLPEDSPLRKPILIIQGSGEKAAAVVQDLLTLARRGVVAAEVVNLNEIISEYLESPEHEKLLSYHPGVHIETHLEKNILNILGSSTHLSKTFMNLVSNAAEAMPEGGKLTISTENRYIDRPIRSYDNVEEGDYVVNTVSDTGTGISPDDMEKIFEPFYTKKKMGRSGTGLGMAVVWGTVKDHNGYIDVQSTEGKGTTFTLYFPVTREKLSEDKSPLAIESYSGNGESILIVDDVEEQRKIASGMLKKLGYSVVSVSSGEEAVEYLKTNKVDLLVLDMIMDPGMDGLDTYKKILEIHPGQKAIIASGFSETERVKEVQSLGAGAYIRKPLLLEKIGLAVKEELGK